MIEDVAELGAGAHLAAAQADGACRMALAQRPVDDVKVVDMLLANMIAGKPGEIEPVADLPFHVGHLRRAGGVPKVALVPVAAGAGDVADGAVVDASMDSM